MRIRSKQASSIRRRSGESRCRMIVAERAGMRCEVCCRAGAVEMAHRIARSQMGEWRASNILALCHSCHEAQRDAKGGGIVARALGQTLHPFTDGQRTDPESVPVQTIYGRVLLKDDGTVEVIAS